MARNDVCGWCGDYRWQHHEKGCALYGHAPWERGIYRCVGFVEKDGVEARRRQLRREHKAHAQG